MKMLTPFHKKPGKEDWFQLIRRISVQEVATQHAAVRLEHCSYKDHLDNVKHSTHGNLPCLLQIAH